MKEGPSGWHNQVLTPANCCNIKMPVRILRIGKRQVVHRLRFKLLIDTEYPTGLAYFQQNPVTTIPKNVRQAIPEELLVWLRKSDHRLLLTEPVSELLHILIPKIRQGGVYAQEGLLPTIPGNVRHYATLRTVIADLQLYRLAAMILRRYKVLKNI